MKRSLAVFLIIICLLGTRFAICEQGKKIRLGYLQNDLHHLPCWIAMEKGFFEQEGAEVKVAGIFKAGPEEMSGFAAANLDIGYVGEAPATTAVANRTASVVVLAQVNKEGSAIVVKRDSDIAAVVQLEGKTLAVPGYAQVQEFLLRKALSKYRVDPKRVKIIVLKPPEMISALATSQIDAFIAWEPYPAKSITMGIGKILLNSPQIWKDHPCCVLVADSKFLKKFPEKVRAIVRAHIKATDFVTDSVEEAVRIGVKYTGMDEKTVRLAMRNIKYDYNPSIEGEIEYVRFLSELGYIKVENPEGFTNRFINTIILEGEVTK